MVVDSLLVKDKDLPNFFKDFKAIKGQSQWVRAVNRNPAGIEVTFVSEQALKAFLELVAPAENWEVQCEIAAVTIITLAPRAGMGHVKIDDKVIVAMLSRYGEVREGKRLTYREYPTIENGLRQFKVKLSGKLAVPSVFNFGKTSFFVSHRGQIKTCIRCGQTGHLVKDCEVVRCYKCGEQGHTTKDCANEVQCTICLNAGHTYRFCPNTFSGILKLSNRFSKIGSRASPVEKPEKSKAVTEPERVEIESIPDTPVDKQTASDSQCAEAAETAAAAGNQSQDIFESQSQISEPVSAVSNVETPMSTIPDVGVFSEGEPSTRSLRNRAGKNKTTV